MRRENHCLALFMRQFGYPLFHRARCLDIESQGGFVKQDNRWIRDESAGDSDFLLHPSRERPNTFISPLPKIEFMQELLSAIFQLFALTAFQVTEIHQVLPCRESPVDISRPLQHCTNLAHCHAMLTCYVKTIHTNATFGRNHESTDHLDGRRLARSVGAKKAKHLACRHR